LTFFVLTQPVETIQSLACVRLHIVSHLICIMLLLVRYPILVASPGSTVYQIGRTSGHRNYKVCMRGDIRKQFCQNNHNHSSFLNNLSILRLSFRYLYVVNGRFLMFVLFHIK